MKDITHNTTPMEKISRVLGTLVTYSLAGQLGAAILLVVLVKSISPLEFGRFSYYSAFVWIAIVLGTLQIEHLFINNREKSKLLILASIAAVSSICSGLLIVLAVNYSAAIIPDILYEGHEGHPIALSVTLGISVMLGSLQQIFRSIAISEGNIRIVALQPAVFSVLSFGIPLTAILLLNYEGSGMLLLWGQMIGLAASSLLYVIYVPSTRLILIQKHAEMIQQLQINLRNIRFVLPTHLTKTLNYRMPHIFFGISGFGEIAGYLLIAERLIGAPLNLVGNSLAVIIRRDIMKSDNHAVLLGGFLRINIRIIQLVLVFIVLLLVAYHEAKFIGELLKLAGYEGWSTGVRLIIVWSFVQLFLVIYAINEDIAQYLSLIKYRFKFHILLASALLMASLVAGSFVGTPVLTLYIFSTIYILAFTFDYFYCMGKVRVSQRTTGRP